MGGVGVAETMRGAVLDVLPLARTKTLPVSDGGEGFTEILLSALGGVRIEKEVHGPLPGQKVRAVYGITADGKSALIEMAQAAGLTLIPEGRRDPKVTTTYGVGELIRDALGRGVAGILLGIGGSGTNDGGAGMAEALGVRFLDREGNRIPRGGAALLELAAIDMSGLEGGLKNVACTVACDVRNPLVGPVGASSVYAPQKGATPADVRLLDDALRNFRAVVLAGTGMDVQRLPGGGAAGGLGAGLAVFCDASLEVGIEIVLDAIRFDEALREADLVITGEGRLDEQTAFGKALGGILLRTKRAGKPALAVVGSFRGQREQYLGPAGFHDLIALAESPADTDRAMEKAGELIVRRTQEILTRFLRSASFHQAKGDTISGKG
jgi:glycerate kinase